MKRYAVHVLYTERNVTCRQQVVMVEGGRCVGHCPLTEELPFTEWMGGVAVLSGWEEIDCRLPASFEEVLHRLSDKSGDCVWHIEAADHACGTVRRLRRLL